MKIIAANDFFGEERYLGPLRNVIEEGDYDLFVYSGGLSTGNKSINEYLNSKLDGREPDKEKEDIQDEIEDKKEDMILFMDFVDDLEIPSIIVPGRTDSPLSEYEDIVRERAEKNSDIHYLHFKFVNMGGFLFSGCGGLLGQESESYFQVMVDFDKVKEMMQNLKTYKREKILILQTPPSFAFEEDIADEYVDHIIDMVEPKILFYGMGEPKKKLRVMNNTITVNPGPLSDGNYVTINTKNMNIRFKNLEEM